MRHSALVVAAVIASACACGGEAPQPITPATQPPPPATTSAPPPSVPTPPPTPADPFAPRTALRRETAPALPVQGPDVDVWERAEKIPVPQVSAAACASVARKGVPMPVDACKDPDKARAHLEIALATDGGSTRDAALLSLETCAGLPRGFARALRAELAPPQCADAIVHDARASLASFDPLTAHALVGYVVAARLARLPSKPPALTGAATRERVLAHLNGPFKLWFAEQAKAIEQLSTIGARLAFYGRAVVAIEAGLAESRFVEAMRSAPLPAEWQKDPDIKAAYYGTLDQLLEPRKVRMRDAMLVAMRDMASCGSLHDARIDRARGALSVMYAGRRIDALDGLMLAPPDATAAAAKPGLWGALPTFYAGIIMRPEEAKDPKLVPLLARRGVPWPMKTALDGVKLDDPALRVAYARARLDLGRTYWRGVDYDAAIALLSQDRATVGDAGKLVLATALALREGPEDAQAMMNAASPAALNLRHTEALDLTAKDGSDTGGRAEYGSALLALISPPEGAGRDHFSGLAERFRRASGKLSRPEDKKRADDAAARADGTAKAL